MLTEACLTVSPRNRQLVDDLTDDLRRVSKAEDPEDSLEEFAGHQFQTGEL
jgi:hypothetical protein